MINILVDNEPEPKRKTLAERAGEPRSMAPPPSSTRHTIKGTSLVVGHFQYILHSYSSIPTLRHSTHRQPISLVSLLDQYSELADFVMDEKLHDSGFYR